MSKFVSKTAFVTGGAQGLGHAYVQKFLDEGSNVFFGDINGDLGRSVEQEFKTKYGQDRVAFAQFDVTNLDKFKEAFGSAVRHFGAVDIMVNNAGILNEGLWEKMIDINYRAAVYGTMLAMEHMRKDKGGRGGRIINVSSVIGIGSHQSMPIYCGTKHAIRAYSTCISMTPGLESEMGIEIAVLCPDAADTELVSKMDETRVIGHSKIKDMLESRKCSVSTITDGLFSLLKRDAINGAILLVVKEGARFQEMERKDLGTEWPVPKDS